MKTATRIFTFLLIAALLGISAKMFIFSEDPLPEEPAMEKKEGVTPKIQSPPMPEQPVFAGDTVPADYFDVREGLDREFLVNTYWHSHTIQLIKLSKRIFPIIEPILEDRGVPKDFKYVAAVESDLRHPTSPAGAKGMWQFMERTAREYNLEVNSQVDERYNIEKSTEAACQYFKDAKEELGSWTLAAASYNVGRHGIKKQQRRQHQEDFYDLLLNEETQRYIYRVIALKYIMKAPEKYGFDLEPNDLYLPVPTYKVSVDSSVTDFANFAEEFNINYKILKYFNPWLRQTYLRNNKGKTYQITIPENGMRSWSKIKTQYQSTQ